MLEVAGDSAARCDHRVFALMDETLRQVGGSLANLVTITVFIKDAEPPVMGAYRSWLRLILCDIRLLSPALEPLVAPDDLLRSLVEAELFQEPDEVVGEGLALTAGWRALEKR